MITICTAIAAYILAKVDMIWHGVTVALMIAMLLDAVVLLTLIDVLTKK